jgi:outer membrane protein assembly factor BamB
MYTAMRTPFSLLCVIVFVTSLNSQERAVDSSVTSLPAVNWPAFRGANGDGVSTESKVPLVWTNKQNVKWKTALPKLANGSPIVSNDCVFVTSAEDDDGRQRSLYCFDRETGQVKWKRTVACAEKMPTHKTNPYCGSTPVADGERVVVWHGSAGLYCYDFSGEELWSLDLGRFEHIWGYGTSPILYKDRVIMNCGPGERFLVTAIDLGTGETVWEADEPHKGNGSAREDGKYMGSWCTPIVANIDGQDQLLIAMPTRLVAYDPADGEIVWFCEGIRGPKGDLAYSSPIIAGNTCVAIGGFNGPAIGVSLSRARGDITEQARLWRRDSSPQNIGSGIHHEGYVYRPNAGPGTIECMDPRTGEILWKDRAAGANHWGSIVFVAGHALVTNQDGVTVVFRPSPKNFELVAKNPLGEPSNSTPAISDGEIFIRTFDHLFCIAD